jgi:hypothetical protein
LNLRVRDLPSGRTLFESSDPSAIAAYSETSDRPWTGESELQYLDIHQCWSKLYAHELARLIKKATRTQSLSPSRGQ